MRNKCPCRYFSRKRINARIHYPVAKERMRTLQNAVTGWVLFHFRSADHATQKTQLFYGSLGTGWCTGRAILRERKHSDIHQPGQAWHSGPIVVQCWTDGSAVGPALNHFGPGSVVPHRSTEIWQTIFYLSHVPPFYGCSPIGPLLPWYCHILWTQLFEKLQHEAQRVRKEGHSIRPTGYRKDTS